MPDGKRIIELDEITELTDEQYYPVSDGTTTGKTSFSAMKGALSKSGFGVRNTPEMYGAAGDGVTDDTTALVQLFEECRDILIPEGKTYAFTSKIVVYSNTDVQFDGIIKAVGTGTTSFEFYDRVTETPGYTGVHDVYFHGCGTFDGSGDKYTDAVATPFRVHHCKNITFEGITIKAWSKYHAIECGGTDGLTIKNVAFSGMFPNGTQGMSEAVQIETITSDGAGGAIPYDNTYTKNVLIEGCSFVAGDGHMLHAVGMHSGQDDTKENMFENIIIRNCILESDISVIGTSVNQLNNSLLSLRYNIRNLLIENNLFTKAAGLAIALYRNMENVRIVRNTILRSETTAIHVGIVNNAITLSNVMIVDNTIINPNMASTSDNGAAIILGACDGAYVCGNTIKQGNPHNSIFIHTPAAAINAGSNCLVSGNRYIQLDGAETFSNASFLNNYRRFANSRNALTTTPFSYGEPQSISLKAYDIVMFYCTIPNVGTETIYIDRRNIASGQVSLRAFNLPDGATNDVTFYETRLTITDTTVEITNAVRTLINENGITAIKADTVGDKSSFMYVSAVVGIVLNGDTFM